MPSEVAQLLSFVVLFITINLMRGTDHARKSS